MSSRSLSDLREPFLSAAKEWMDDCKCAGLDILVYCTLRSIPEQDELFRQGRDLPGKIVTNAKGGQSAHNFGLALDFVPLFGGKPQWKAGSALYVNAVTLAHSRGLESGSEWKGRLADWPHLQWPNWRALL